MIQRPALSALVGVTVLYSAVVVWGVVTRHDFPVADWLYSLVLLAGVAVAAGAWRRAAGPQRRQLGWALAGLACLAVAETAGVAFYDLQNRQTPDLSVLDALYYLYYLCLLAVVLMARSGRVSAGEEWAGGSWLLDSLITGLVVAELSWVLALAPLLQTPGSSVMLKAVSLSYVALDLTLLTASLLTLRQPLSRARWPLLLGLLAYVGADLGYLMLGRLYQPRGLMDLLWAWGATGQVVGVTLLGSGAGELGRRAAARLETLLRALPYGAVAVACALLVVRGARADLTGQGVVWFTVTVFLLVMVRQALNFAEVRGLNRRLTVQARELRRRHAEMTHLAHHDGLTGLLNRSGFYRLLSSSAGQPMTLLLLDLDGFKPVNDTYGHLAGDEVLREVGRRLREVSAPEFTPARIGGDEFALLSTAALSRLEAQATAQRVVEALAQPFHLSSDQVRLGVSVGVTCAEGTRDLHDLMGRADAALYGAKRAGGSRAQLAFPEEGGVLASGA